MSSAARDYFEGYRIQGTTFRAKCPRGKTFVFLIQIVYNGVWAFARKSIIRKRKDYEKAF